MCSRWDIQYVGQTMLRIKDRFKAPFYSIEKQDLLQVGAPSSVEFWNDLEAVFDEIKSSCFKYYYVLGDLNSDPNTIHGQRLINFCLRQNMCCLVDEPTRITSTSATVLDQIITNAPTFVKKVEVLPPVSTNDHCTVSAKLNFKIAKESAYTRLVWQYNKADDEGFRKALNETDFSTVFDSHDIDNCCLKWTERFLNIARSFIPNKIVTIRPNDSPWYSNALRLLKRKMNRMFNIFKRTNNSRHWDKYGLLRTEYQQNLDEAEANYKKNLSFSLSNAKCSKKWWSTVKWLIGKGGDTSYPVLNCNNSAVTDNKEKACKFNDFFLSHSTIDTTNATLPNDPLNQVQFDFISAKENEVADLLKCIDTSKATGPDNISPKMLKMAGNSIVASLTKLINMSLSTGSVPKSWKEANVIPLFKKGDRSDINNYRPVSILPTLSKILEKIVFKNLFNYLRDKNLLTPHQSGFRPGDSTVNQLSYLYHVFANALDNKKNLRIVFCDISKAFDRCWHKGILYKLRCLGVGGTMLEWFQDYLSNRQQKVLLRGQSSERGLIQAGVPQGSVLGPLLFLIYINDLPNIVVSNIKLFADDATVYIDFSDSEHAANILNQDMSHIQDWADQWLVKFSPAKTKSMTLSFKHENNIPNINFNDVTLENVESHKHLGLTLTHNLTWKLHINNLLQSVSPMADVLKKLKYIVDRKSLENIYFSFLRPKMEYCSHIWDNCNKRESDLLENFQLDIARTVAGARRGTSHQAIYDELGWKTLAFRRESLKLKQFAKMEEGKAPPYLCQLLPAKVGGSRALRNKNNLQLFKCRTQTFKNSFIPSTTKLWNTLDETNRNVIYASELLKYQSNKLFEYGIRETGIKHAQLRMKCSKLNAHLFALHVIDSPECSCGFDNEDTNHFLLQCPLYDHERNIIMMELTDLGLNDINVDLLLYGKQDKDVNFNINIFSIVHAFIEETDRL